MQAFIHRTVPAAEVSEPTARREARSVIQVPLRVVALCVAALLAAPAAVGQTSRYEAAQVDYEIGHFERAFAAFASLADEGHCESARVAIQMVRHGRALYPTDYQVTPERRARWQRLPACPMTMADADADRRAR